MQQVVDLIAAGDPAAGDSFVTGEVTPALVDGQTDFSTIGEGTLEFGREDVVPVGTVVSSCEIIGGGAFGEDTGFGRWYDGSYFMADGTEIGIPSFVAGGPVPELDTFPGDTVCLLQNHEDPPGGPEAYNQNGFHLVLKGTEDGSVEIRLIGLGWFGAEI